MSKKALGCAVVLSALAASAPALAADLFGVTATGSGGTTVSATGSNLPDLLDHAVNNTGSFSSLAGQAVSSSVDYAGVPNAIGVSVNASGTSATLTLPGIGFSKTFTGTSKDDLQNQIEDFLKKNGSDVVARFLASINRQTVAAIVDGNPSSQTAVTAQSAFNRWGGFGGGNLTEGAGGLYSNIQATATRFDLDGYSSTLAGVDATLGYRFNPNVGLFGTLSVAGQDTEGSKVGRASCELALPIRALSDRGFTVTVTPLAQVAGAGSVDMVNGGLFWGVGAAGHLTYAFGYGLTFGVGAQYMKDKGMPLKVGELSFDTEVDQSVLSYGVDAAWNFSGNMNLVGGVAKHKLLDDAADASWLQPSVGFRWGRTTLLEVGYEGVFGGKVKGNGGYLRFGWRW